MSFNRIYTFCYTSFSQTTEDSVRQTVNNLFAGMKTSNGAMIVAAFADSAVLQTLSCDKTSGKITVTNESVKEFAN